MTQSDGTYDTTQAKQLTLTTLLSVFSAAGVTKTFVKALAPNDNSKNQPYFGGHLTDIAFIPSGEPIASVTSSGKTSDPKRQIKYQVPLNLTWIDATGQQYPAPNAKLIYYPQYPEVRFSGFLKGSKVNARYWMDPNKQGRAEGRWLMLGVRPDKSIIAYLVTPECNLAAELAITDKIALNTIFYQLDTHEQHTSITTRDALIEKLLEIHNLGWITGRKLTKNFVAEAYDKPNGGGYTLEAMLGIPPNGFAEPDYLGWEVKQFGVKAYPRKGTRPTTLFTPEPDGGIYKDQSAIQFMRIYGYAAKNGEHDRLNFSGKHVAGVRNKTTNLTLDVLGFDSNKRLITDSQGVIALLDKGDNIAASWSFEKLMNHWKRKHAQAVYIPCLKQRAKDGNVQYQYGKDIELGVGTDFEMFLSTVVDSFVFYDPGLNLKQASTEKPKIKRRNQIRVNHGNLGVLYKKFEFLDLTH